MSIEHHVLQSADPGRADDYDNCFYACRFCNTARGILPNTNDLGASLLEPCSQVWGDHFRSRWARLEAMAGDASAEYTHLAYDLDDPRKQQIRRNRRRLVREALRVLAETPQRIRGLLAEAVTVTNPAPLIQAAKELRRHARNAGRDLVRYRAVPTSAEDPCQCGPGAVLALPDFLASQTLTYNP